jgi:peptidoglycan hydrolase-like protein with peptidoglycan-binding domain
VCAWQYVYGTHPIPEADLGARAVAAGADCLAIDAEAEYEGHYGAAQSYITELRAKIGPSYPLGLASFPYVDFHPSLPYSVFLGPGGAQYNAPQMYWKAIGTTVDTVYSHTFVENRIYGRPIFPLGQSYDNPSSADLLRFRQLAGAYGTTGYSWWDWQETSASGWASMAGPVPPPGGVTPAAGMPALKQGSKGDPVLWMQEHLAAVVPPQPTTGVFDATTAANLETFQANRGIPASGVTDTATWQALLALAPVPVDWTGGGPQAASASFRRGAARVAAAPESARLPAVRDEIGEPGSARAHHARPARRR